jgi:hypothetical protein
MKDWKATVRTWKKNNSSNVTQFTPKKTPAEIEWENDQEYRRKQKERNEILERELRR